MLAAERGGERIAVEIKSFIKPSLVQDLKEALKQYILCEGALLESPENIGRTPFLAIRTATYEAIFDEATGKMQLRHAKLKMIVYDSEKEEIVEWKN